MRTKAKPPLDVVGVPIVFSGYDLEEFYVPRKGFSQERLRERQMEKALQVVLATSHGIATTSPEQVYRHVTPLTFSLLKDRSKRPGCYLMTIEYRFQGAAWRHVFRYERDLKGEISVSGRLYTHARRPIVAK